MNKIDLISLAISILAIIVALLVSVKLIVETNLIYKNINAHNEKTVWQYKGLNEYEVKNGIDPTPPPTIKRRKGGYISLVPHPNQVKHFNELKP